jgi:WD40 repeat protein
VEDWYRVPKVCNLYLTAWEVAELNIVAPDRTIRTYAFPWLKPELVLRGHRAAVNAVSIAGDMVVSGSGDRSVRVWDARTGALISNFEDHHARACVLSSLDEAFLTSTFCLGYLP